jgi:hypothetical protein
MYAIPVVVRSSLLCSIAPVTRERGNKGENKTNLTGRIRGSSTPSRPIPVFIKSKESSKRAGQTRKGQIKRRMKRVPTLSPRICT